MSQSSEYAIIKAAGGQVKAVVGDVLRLDKLIGDPGAEVTFPHVLLLAAGADVEVGKPDVAGAKVIGQIVRHAQGKKLRIYRYKKKKGYQRTLGHRSDYTFVRVTGISRG